MCLIDQAVAGTFTIGASWWSRLSGRNAHRKIGWESSHPQAGEVRS